MNEQESAITVLLVDDEEEFLEVTSRVLRRRGIEVFTSTNGAVALSILKQASVDVVVLDIKMPGLDGAEVFDRIKALRPGLPVIILTGHGSVGQAFRMSKEGVYDYLAKPCNIDSLAVMIQRAAAERPAGEVDLGEGADATLDPIRILIVDDEQELLDSLGRILRRRGMEVHTVHSGEQALSELVRLRVDVIILDVKLPGMGGMDVLARLRGLAPGVAVIMLTGHPSVESAVEGMRCGAVDYIAKPADTEALVRTIRRAHADRRRRLEEERARAIRDILEHYPD